MNFKEIELTDFYASARYEKFPNIEHFAMKMLVLFTSADICEQTLSCNKSK